ncbi:MAG: RNase P modulator RnpM [Anaerolineales bacterium]|jgi:predicted RNA-binding protein YlxR (DUF448 family)
MVRRKHVPQRMCVACRQSQDKKTLVRIVRTPQGVVVDETGKMPGRGAYLHSDPECWEKGIKGALPKALNTDISPADRERLLAFLESHSGKAADKDENR